MWKKCRLYSFLTSFLFLLLLLRLLPFLLLLLLLLPPPSSPAPFFPLRPTLRYTSMLLFTSQKQQRQQLQPPPPLLLLPLLSSPFLLSPPTPPPPSAPAFPLFPPLYLFLSSCSGPSVTAAAAEKAEFGPAKPRPACQRKSMDDQRLLLLSPQTPRRQDCQASPLPPLPPLPSPPSSWWPCDFFLDLAGRSTFQQHTPCF